MKIAFDKYLPDIPATGIHLTTANNCLPAFGHYGAVKDLGNLSNAAAEAVLGGGGFKSSTGTMFNFFGTNAYLYRWAYSTGALTDVSKAGGYTTGTGRWEMVLFGDRVIATNGVQKPQSWVIGTSTVFADLTANDVIAKTVGIVGGFVFLGHMTEGGVTYPNRIRWSALENPTDFTASVSTQSDFQDLFGEKSIGVVQRIVGGQVGTVFCEKAIFSLTYTGGDTIFQIDQTSSNIGTHAPKSVVAHGDTIFFLGNNGFYMKTADGLIPIGEGKVDETFFAELYKPEIHNVTGAISTRKGLYFVAYPTSAGGLHKMLVYNWLADRWSTMTPTTLEALMTMYDTLEEVTVGANTAHKVGPFSGSVLTATFETGEMQHNPGGKTLIRNITPMVEGTASTLTAQVGYRNTTQETVTYTTDTASNSEGEVNIFNIARYQRIKTTVAGGFDKAFGVDIDVVAQGKY